MGIRVLYLPQKKDGTDYLAFLKVAKILRQEKTDVIHTHNTQPFIDGTIAAMISGVKTIVHTDHARDFPDKRRYMFAEWMMSQFAYKVVGVSEHTSKNLMKYEKISSKKIKSRWTHNRSGCTTHRTKGHYLFTTGDANSD